MGETAKTSLAYGPQRLDTENFELLKPSMNELSPKRQQTEKPQLGESLQKTLTIKKLDS